VLTVEEARNGVQIAVRQLAERDCGWQIVFAGSAGDELGLSCGERPQQKSEDHELTQRTHTIQVSLLGDGFLKY